MSSSHAAILRAVDVILYERAALLRQGPCLTITHRLWIPGTLCLPGEEVLGVELRHRARAMALPLSLQLRLMMDYLARNQQQGQSASQIAAGINSHPFFQRHAANTPGRIDLRKRFSRAAVKQQIMRIRRVLDLAAWRVGLMLCSSRILVSETSDTNETHYRLKAVVGWRHIQS